MSELLPYLTKIPAPRTPLIDERTGLMAREWYKFFYNLFDLTGAGGNFNSLEDVQKGPPNIPVEIFQIDPNAPTNAPTDSPLLSQINQIDKQLNALESAPKPDLGSMAALQQTDLPWVTFNTNPNPIPVATGSLYWDTADSIKTLSLVMEDSGNVVQQIGEETYYRIKATAPITEGQVVMFTGTVGSSGALTGAPATGLTYTQSEYVMGIATQNIALNGWGYVTWFGLVKGINTTGGAEAWVDGQLLYYNPAVAGGLTKTIPTAPNPKVLMAAVVKAAANGSLFVRPTFGSAFGETDSNVQITGLANGDLIQYVSANSRWENIPASSIITGAGGPPVTKTANFSVAAGETWIINNKVGSSCTATLPAAASSTGRVLYFQNYQAQTLVSNASNVVPLAGGAAGTAILAAVAGDTATLVSDGSNWIMTQYVPNNVLLLE